MCKETIYKVELEIIEGMNKETLLLLKTGIIETIKYHKKMDADLSLILNDVNRTLTGLYRKDEKLEVC